MSVFMKNVRPLLALLLIAAAVLFSGPFASHLPEGNEATNVSGFALLSEMDHVTIGETDYPADSKEAPFTQENGEPEQIDFSNYELSPLEQLA